MLKDIDGHWSRSVLEDFIAEGLYQAQGSLPSNFDTTLPEDYSAKVKEVLKDPYDFGFLKMPLKYQERDLEVLRGSGVEGHRFQAGICGQT